MIGAGAHNCFLASKGFPGGEFLELGRPEPPPLIAPQSDLLGHLLAQTAPCLSLLIGHDRKRLILVRGTCSVRVWPRGMACVTKSSFTCDVIPLFFLSAWWALDAASLALLLQPHTIICHTRKCLFRGNLDFLGTMSERRIAADTPNSKR